VLESLFHWAATYARRGNVGRHSNVAIARGIGWAGDPDALVDALVEIGWFDTCCDEHRLRFHDWPDHADQSVHRSKDVVTLGFLECYGSSLEQAKELVNSPEKPTHQGLRLKAQGTGLKAQGKRRKSGKSELESLAAEPEIKTLADIWVENVGGTITLGLVRAIQRCLAAGYEIVVPIDAMMAIRTARTNPERYPEKSFARWCANNNSQPGYVLRPEKVEELAAEYQRYGQSPKPVPVSVPHKRITDRTDEPAPDDVFKAIQEQNRKALGK
jgi:hypothetical protein